MQCEYCINQRRCSIIEHQAAQIQLFFTIVPRSLDVKRVALPRLRIFVARGSLCSAIYTTMKSDLPGALCYTINADRFNRANVY